MGKIYQCCEQTGKKQYPDFYIAAKKMKRIAKINREDVGDLNVWRCRHCSYWHIGHKVAKIKEDLP